MYYGVVGKGKRIVCVKKTPGRSSISRRAVGIGGVKLNLMGVF